MASVPKISVKLDIIETEELKKAIAVELDKINKKAKAEIDTAIAKVFKKYVKDKETDEND